MEYVKIEILLPEETIQPMRDRLNEIGVLTIGNYDHVISYTQTNGYWRPLQGAEPVNGEIGSISFGSECKLEFRCQKSLLDQAKTIIHEIHPYDEPVIYIIPLL